VPVEEVGIPEVAPRVAREGALALEVHLQLGVAPRGVGFDLRADRPDLRRHLALLGERSEALDEGHERVAVRLHRELALRAVREDEDVGLLQRAVAGRVVLVDVVDPELERNDVGGAGVEHELRERSAERAGGSGDDDDAVLHRAAGAEDPVEDGGDRAEVAVGELRVHRVVRSVGEEAAARRGDVALRQLDGPRRLVEEAADEAGQREEDGQQREDDEHEQGRDDLDADLQEQPLRVALLAPALLREPPVHAVEGERRPDEDERAAEEVPNDHRASR
jgi:hypothetical protein